MQFELTPHPESPGGPASAIAVAVSHQAGGAVLFAYELRGAVDDIRLPPPAPAQHTDGLWRTTCFEAFVGFGAGYHEYNFSPSGAWAAYRFAGYREGMARADQCAAPVIECRAVDGVLTLSAEAHLPAEVAENAGDFSLGLSAVVEARDGGKSYWALAHPPGPPDFHHADCFTAQIPRAWAP